MSDRVPGATTLEERMDDIRAVMDAVGSERAAVIGESEGGPLAMLFAAAHPERTVALILQGAEVRERTDEDWPWGESTDEAFEAAMTTLPERWGKGLGFPFLAPSVGAVEWGLAWRGRVQTHANTPISSASSPTWWLRTSMARRPTSGVAAGAGIPDPPGGCSV